MSRSELHNWECAIESLCGDNADQMLAIAQDIYNTAFVHGKNCTSLPIESIIADIEAARDKDKLCEYPYNRCINIIKKAVGDES